MQNKEFDLHEYIAERGLKYYIETYGCQMNSHDSEKLAGILESLGYAKASSPESADFILFNTCCVRENAEKRLYGNVGVYKKRRQMNKSLIVAVCGCMMQQEGAAERLVKTFPFVRIAFGTHNMHMLPEMIYKVITTGKRAVCIEKDSGLIVEDIPVHRNCPPLSYVSIMQGCDNFCSYCIVPYVRGREKSRSPEAIINEVKSLAESGYQEVMLLGQNVNSYGKGLEGGISFPELLARVAKETPMSRIRFMTSHPKDVSDELIKVIAENKNICKQLHLPVQSGSTEVLKRMNRKYSREQYLSLIDKVRKEIPDIGLTTDVIVGFPGETQEDFELTMSLMEQVKYDAAFTFVYSVRTGTKAANMEGHIDERTKQQRIMQLVALQNKITLEKNRDCEGKTYEVLVEGVSHRDEGCMCGRTEFGKMVNFKGDSSMIGKIVNIKITEGKKTTLFGCMDNI